MGLNDRSSLRGAEREAVENGARNVRHGQIQELWRAREEMGTRSWSVEKFVQKWNIIQSMRKNGKAITGHILRDRIESWKVSKDHPDNEYPSIQSSEVDIIGHALDDRLLLEAETGEQGILNMIL